MPKISIRLQKVEDADRFFEILNQTGLANFGIRPESAESEAEWLKQTQKKANDNFSHNYSIIYDGSVVGGIGLKINQHEKYIGEIGYFIDENYWGRGIATEAVRQIEKIGFEKLDLERIEIRISPENPASEKVAIKSGYSKEGLLANSHRDIDGKMRDSYLYAKIKRTNS